MRRVNIRGARRDSRIPASCGLSLLSLSLSGRSTIHYYILPARSSFSSSSIPSCYISLTKHSIDSSLSLSLRLRHFVQHRGFYSRLRPLHVRICRRSRTREGELKEKMVSLMLMPAEGIASRVFWRCSVSRVYRIVSTILWFVHPREEKFTKREDQKEAVHLGLAVHGWRFYCVYIRDEDHNEDGHRTGSSCTLGPLYIRSEPSPGNTTAEHLILRVLCILYSNCIVEILDYELPFCIELWPIHSCHKLSTMNSTCCMIYE